MRIQLTSDNHLEFRKNAHKFFKKLEVHAPTLVIAGDLCTHSRIRGVIQQACDRFEHVIHVCGNHEYYGSSFPYVQETLRTLDSKIGNYHFLHRRKIEIEGTTLIGATSWFNPLGKPTDIMNDYRKIQNFSESVLGEYMLDTNFLYNEVCDNSIVITHHAPHIQSLPQHRRGRPETDFYFNDREDLILEKTPLAWLHGHVHSNSDYMLGSTRVLCNPYGYFPNFLNKGYEIKGIEL